jgi:hypothetical protein
MKFNSSLNFPTTKCENSTFLPLLSNHPEVNDIVGFSGAWEVNVYRGTNAGLSYDLSRA